MSHFISAVAFVNRHVCFKNKCALPVTTKGYELPQSHCVDNWKGTLKIIFERHLILDIERAARLLLENTKAALQNYLIEIPLKIEAQSRI